MEDSTLQPDRISFCAMLNGCAKAQNLSRAEAISKKFKERILKCYMNCWYVRAIVFKLIKLEIIWHYVEEVRKVVGRPWLWKSEQSCDSYGEEICSRALAQMWFEKMLNYRIQSDLIAYNALIAACARQGNLDKAEDVLAKALLQRTTPDLVTYNSLLHTCARSSRQQDIQRVLDQLIVFLSALVMGRQAWNSRCLRFWS